MAKYNSKLQTSFDRFYYSFSLDFWLILANTLAVANWAIDSTNTLTLLALPLIAFGSAWAFVNKSRQNQKAFRNFIDRYKLTGILTLSLALLTLVTVFNFATSPSHAFIVNNDGVSVFKQLFTGSNSSNSSNELSNFGNTIVLAIRVAFLMAGIGALVLAAEELKNRSDWTDVVKLPIIYAVVLGAAELIAGMLLKAPA
jgi:ribose/xylose/arabinose/galactoside ABC-type transport system permease subunit